MQILSFMAPKMLTIQECAIEICLPCVTVQKLIQKYELHLVIIDDVYKVDYNQLFNAFLTECSPLWDIKILILENSNKLVLVRKIMTWAKACFISGNLKTDKEILAFFSVINTSIQAHYLRLLYGKKNETAYTECSCPGCKFNHTGLVFNSKILERANILSENIRKNVLFERFVCLIKERNASYFETLEELIEQIKLEEISLFKELNKENETLKEMGVEIWIKACDVISLDDLLEEDQGDDVFEDDILEEDQEDQGDDVFEYIILEEDQEDQGDGV